MKQKMKIIGMKHIKICLCYAPDQSCEICKPTLGHLTKKEREELVRKEDEEMRERAISERNRLNIPWDKKIKK